MNLKHSTDTDLLNKTRALVSEEAQLSTMIIHHLREIEARKLFAGLGYSSLFEYAVKDLGYSEASAQRRIASMRLMKELPQVEEKIQNRELSLSVVAQAQTYFRQEEKLGRKLTITEKEQVLNELTGKTTREAERELLSLSTSPEKHRPDLIRPFTEDTSLLSFVATNETVKDLEQLKGLLAHQHPNLTLGELVAILAKRALSELDPARQKRSVSAPKVRDTSQPRGTHKATSKSQALRKPIAISVRRAVWKRDDSRCTFTTPDGKRCESRYQLEIDHIAGLASGNDEKNLRLLCRQHNAWAASQRYGREKVQIYWRKP